MLATDWIPTTDSLMMLEDAWVLDETTVSAEVAAVDIDVEALYNSVPSEVAVTLSMTTDDCMVIAV